MNQLFHDHRLQVIGLLLFFVAAYTFVFWATGRLKENYEDRCRLLAFKIMEANTVDHALALEDELDLMYEDFYEKDPEKVTAARIYLSAQLDMKIKHLTGYAGLSL